jgi:hypothetical protein
MSTNTTGVLLHHIGCFGDGDGDASGHFVVVQAINYPSPISYINVT